jgi:CRP-like cAMP-binding protein
VTPTVDLLSRDPALAEGVPEEEREHAVRLLRTSVAELDAGSSDATRWPQISQPAFGLLLLDGYVLRESPAGPGAVVELLCPGDLLRPWDELALLDELPPRWRILERSTLAVLDRTFAERASRWPSVAVALLERVMRRQRQATLLLEVRALPRVQDRVLAVLWSLAERIGHVTPDGVEVTVRLRQADVAALAGARRPTVNLTLRALREQGLLRAWSGAGYVLDPEVGTRVTARFAGTPPQG